MSNYRKNDLQLIGSLLMIAILIVYLCVLGLNETVERIKVCSDLGYSYVAGHQNSFCADRETGKLYLFEMMER